MQEVLDQLFGIKIRDVDRDIEDVPSLHGDLWLDNDGCLNPEIAKEYQERYAKSSAHMSRAFLKGAALRASKCIAAVLPLLNEQSEAPVTTSQAIVLFSNPRHSMVTVS